MFLKHITCKKDTDLNLIHLKSINKKMMSRFILVSIFALTIEITCEPTHPSESTEDPVS